MSKETHWVAISATDGALYALDSEANIYVFGGNKVSRLPTPDEAELLMQEEGDLEKFFLRQWERPVPPKTEETPKSCNMHVDCNAAEAQAAKDGKPELFGPGSCRLHHCYDDGCEDCFGS